MKRCALYVVFALLAGFVLFEALFTLVSTVIRDHPSLSTYSLSGHVKESSIYIPRKRKTDVNHKTGYSDINHAHIIPHCSFFPVWYTLKLLF